MRERGEGGRACLTEALSSPELQARERAEAVGGAQPGAVGGCGWAGLAVGSLVSDHSHYLSRSMSPGSGGQREGCGHSPSGGAR